MSLKEFLEQTKELLPCQNLDFATSVIGFLGGKNPQEVLSATDIRPPIRLQTGMCRAAAFVDADGKRWFIHFHVGMPLETTFEIEESIKKGHWPKIRLRSVSAESAGGPATLDLGEIRIYPI